MYINTFFSVPRIIEISSSTSYPTADEWPLYLPPHLKTWALRVHVLSVFFSMLYTPIYLWVFPLLFFYPTGSVLLFFFAHLWFFVRSRCSAHWSFASIDLCMISLISAFVFMSEFLILSLLVTSSLFLYSSLGNGQFTLWWMVSEWQSLCSMCHCS